MLKYLKMQYSTTKQRSKGLFIDFIIYYYLNTSILQNNDPQYLEYTENRNYKFNIMNVPYDLKTGKIIGNCNKLLKDGRFSLLYSDRYVKR